jgi:hypothetical protein
MGLNEKGANRRHDHSKCHNEWKRVHHRFHARLCDAEQKEWRLTTTHPSKLCAGIFQRAPQYIGKILKIMMMTMNSPPRNTLRYNPRAIFSLGELEKTFSGPEMGGGAWEDISEGNWAP